MSPRFHLRPLSVQPDTRLVELAAEGDERAFETLVKRHRRSLAAYCRRIGLPEHRAEDVVQQALTGAWVALSGGAEVREPRAWLYRIVHNTTMNAIRAERRHLHEPIEAAATAEAQPGAGEIDAGLRARDALGHVAALPEQQRDALLLTAIEGRSHDEAADVMGLSDGAVRGLLYRARTNLRRAAAAFGPQGLLGWIGRTAGDGPLAGRTAEVSAGGAAAGAAGLLGKGAIATGVAALLAAGGTIVHLEGGGSARGHRHVAAVSRRSASVERGSVTARTSVVADAQLRAGSAKPVVNRAVRRSSASVTVPQRSSDRHGSRKLYPGEANHESNRHSSSGGSRETTGDETSEYTGASVASSGSGGDSSMVYGGATQPSGDQSTETPLSGEKSSHVSDDPPETKDEEEREREKLTSGGETTTPTEEPQKRSDG